MNISCNSFKRPTAFLTATALLVGISVPAFLATQKVGAAQVQTRSIQMSDSTPGATGVKYTVSFTTATTAVIQGVVIDFCTTNPIIGESCTAPTGMNAASAGWTSPATGLNPTTGWAVSSATANKLALTYASGLSVNSGVAVSFELTNITNPTDVGTPDVGTFYARILTYTTKAAADAYTSASPGTYTDYGGVALATSYNIPVTAKVMETLMFCTSDVTISTNCVTLTQPSVNLGKTVGSTIVLDSAAVYTDQVYAKLSTNAVGGVTVRVKTTSSATCSGLSKDNGATCAQIPAVASGATTPITITAGTAAFGMSITGAGGLTATLPYNSGTQYGMDDSSATKAWSTYGSPLASTTGPVNGATATIKYAATASNTTPAAIYTTTQSLIATGTF